METIFASLLIVASSTFKYLVGMVIAVGNENVGLLESYVYNVGGGIIGIILFTHFGALLQKFLKERLNLGAVIFSRKTRMLVNVRRRFGLAGIAFITPVILSIPIGIGVSLSLTKDKSKIVLLMIISCLFWSSALFLPYYLFDVNMHEIITSWLR